MKEKGFTLIELLAVIVILAIIALIATPIILGIINNAREEANKRSVELYENAVELAVARKNLTEDFNPSSCTIESGVVTCDGTELKVEVDGEVPKEGTIIFKENKIESAELVFEKYKATINENGKITITDKKETIPTTPTITKACTYVDSEDDTGAAIGVIDLSDVVTCGTESFYVMENDGNNITMLSMYNLNVGDNKYPNEETYGIQDENVVVGGYTKYGKVRFSTTEYWYTDEYTVDTNYAEEGRESAYVYGDYKDANGNQQNIIYPYVNAYETYLKETLKVNSASASLMSYEQLKTLGCDKTKWTCGPDMGDGALETPAEPWVYSTTYWTGSAHDAHYNVWYVSSGGYFSSAPYDAGTGLGVRPVITISTSEIQ